jgi:DnaJ-domain-containing protein 1
MPKNDATSGRTDERIYVYGVVPHATDDPLSLSTLTGLQGRPVGLIAAGQLAAVVSSTSLTDLAACSQEELHGLVAQHQRIGQDLLARAPLVPFAFGMIANTPAEVGALLVQANVQFVAGLRKARLHLEVAVQGRLQEQQFVADLFGSNTEVQALHAAVLTAEGDPLPAQMALGRRVFEEREKIRQELLRDAAAELSRAAEATKVAQPLGDQVFNLSFLVRKDAEAAFDAALEAFAERQPDWLELNYIGPLPLNSFLHINLQRGDFAQIDASRRTLDLPERATRDQIQAAYRRQAAQHHPDKHIATGDAAALEAATQAMQGIVASYESLVVYFERATGLPWGVSSSSADPAECSFRQEDVEQTLVVRAH